MPEAEAALRLAFFLLGSPGCAPEIEVNMDGAQVSVGKKTIFPVREFLLDSGWQLVTPIGSRDWQGIYQNGVRRIIVRSQTALGDVIAKVGNHRLRAECKKGPLKQSKGSKEYKALWEAIGQLVATEHVGHQDILIGAVPLTDTFAKLVENWRRRPLVVQSGIKFLMVGRNGDVRGCESLGIE
jgi:hypothetical protein